MWDHNLRASGAREMRQEALTRALFLVYVCFARCPVAVDLFFFCGFSPLALSSSPPPLSLSAPRRDHPRRDPRTRDPGGKRGRASRSFTFVLFPFLFLFRRLGARRVTRERRESPDFLFSDPDFLVRPPLQILSCNQSSKPVVVVVVVVAKKKKKLSSSDSRLPTVLNKKNATGAPIPTLSLSLLLLLLLLLPPRLLLLSFTRS